MANLALRLCFQRGFVNAIAVTGFGAEGGIVETVNNQYLGGDASLACSPETQTQIDQEVMELIENQYCKAYEILRENRQKLDELAKYLYEKETITGEEFMNILDA